MSNRVLDPCECFIQDYSGELQRARCKHCIFLSMKKQVRFYETYVSQCSVDGSFHGITNFACGKFKPRINYMVKSMSNQLNLFL